MGCSISRKRFSKFDRNIHGNRVGPSFRNENFQKKVSINNKRKSVVENIEPSTKNGNIVGNKFKFRFDQRVLQKYHIEALIGQGSFSSVVRAKHRLTKTEYAIKIVSRSDDDQSIVPLCETELRVLRRVRHRNIIQLVEVFDSGPNLRIYMVMELCKGGELFDRIVEHGPMLEVPAAKAVNQVIDGVRYLHNLAITHRDLKLENILYVHSDANSKRLVISDYGLAKINSKPGDRMHTTCGTPEYIAPELLKRMTYTSSVDCWALGVVSFAVLSGMMPFEDEDRIELYRKILHGDINWDDEAWQGLSYRSRDFVKKLLDVKKSDRMSATEASRHPFIQAAHEYDQQMARSARDNKPQRAGSRHSDHSGKTDKSQRSLRSQHRRVREDELDQLLRKYETNVSH